ncbi:DNA mismatch repair protein MutS [Paenibacillus albiflavus]|uniref:DNA mismatch repair protein MutS n=1 Tax=Paenibacillus albiflavus TaxID=2545760 RepID=A0A4V2WP27_9BACL|nr:DNA mismatch repair protein MutS [Paenibacillus albiflavus]TCZ77712.1 DNA mismatch repair protein MutS [Paenibacillus albiflavus]
MNPQTIKQLEFEKIKEKLISYTMSYLGKKHVHELMPQTNLTAAMNLLHETNEAVKLIEHGSSVPIPSLDGIEMIVNKFGKGYIFTENEFSHIARLLESTSQLKRYMVKKESIAPKVCAYAQSLYDMKELDTEINRCIRHGQITDEASNDLSRTRKKIIVTDSRIRKKLDSTMNKYKSYLQELVVSMRNDRYVIPVKKEYRKLVAGTVLDESSSGQTVFVEPSDIAALHYELSEYRMEEAREEARILSQLTDLTELYAHEISVNLETIGYYDFLFAKAKYGHSIGGRIVQLNNEGIIRIVEGRHPLLSRNTVPLTFTIGEDYSALIITGPNTGGKTVSLKTVGLLTLMVQSGLLVPVQEGSMFHVYSNILVDIGDGQSMEQSLSTFSAHIKNVIEILKQAGRSTLILLDELATGTDPGEGIGLSIAVLEELYKRGSTVIATTHFNEIKEFARVTAGFQNARMEFDLETLQPLYRLTIGEAGNSYAFYIALKLGIAPNIIERSKQITSRVARGNELTDFTALEPLTPISDPIKLQPNQNHSKAKRQAPAPLFERGDCVWIHSLRRSGIVCGPPDERGNIVVQIQKEKVTINQKRMALYIERKELYPEGEYDMDIVFESKENRKKHKLMNRKHVEGLSITYPKDQS